MSTSQIFNQWFDINRALLEPFVRWNEVALQTAEKVASNRQFFDQWFEIHRTAADPFLRWGEIAFSIGEKVARRNLTLAQDYLDLSVRHVNLLREVRDPQKWADEEGKLAVEFSQKIVNHAGDYLKVAQESQNAFKAWASEAVQQASEAAQKTASSAARTTSETAAKAAETAKSSAAQAQKS